MPINFGKNAGRQVPGVGVLLAEGEQERFQRAERNRMGALDRRTIRDAEEDQAYIYNVGPYTRTLSTLGSVGIVFIPGLAEDKVLKGLSVAGPFIEQALPELYPSEPPGRVLKSELPDHLIWKDADGEEFALADRPSIDKALRIIGGHQDSKKNPYAASPYQQGCFVSAIPEQTAQPKEPKEPDGRSSAQTRREYSKALLQYEDDVRFWLKWEASVTGAQKRFEAWALNRGQEYSLAFANGNYRWEEKLNEELHMLARVLGKTSEDWRFLAGNPMNIKARPCWSCGRPVESGRPKCICGELQISQEAYDAMRKERMAGTAA